MQKKEVIMNRAKSLLPVLVVAAFLAGAAGAAGPPSEEGWALLSDAAVARLGPDPNSGRSSWGPPADSTETSAT
mgnify:CR=1 FL=1